MEVCLLWELKKHGEPFCSNQTTFTDSLIMIGDSTDICSEKVVEMVKKHLNKHVERECAVTTELPHVLPIFKSDEIPAHDDKFFPKSEKRNQ